MSHANNIIAAPIDLKGDIGAVLGTGSGDLGYNIRYGSINWKSNNKPYRSNSLTTLSDSVRGGSPYNYGMSWPQFSSPSAAVSGSYLFDIYEDDAASSARAAMNGWQYLRPRGMNGGGQGAHEWYRALDFNYYNHGATEPIIISPGNIAASTNLATSATIAALRKEVFAIGEMNFSTMTAVKDMYFCLVGYRLEGDPNPNTFFVVSAPSKISTGLFSATIDFTGANFPSNRLGTWYIYPCLCSVGGINYYQNGQSNLPSATYYPLPCTKRWTASVASNQRNADLYGIKEPSDKTKAWYRLRINNDGAAYTFNNVRVWFMHNYHTPSDVMDADEKYVDLGNIYVDGYDNYDTGTVYLNTTIQTSLWPDLTLYATCSAGFDRVGPIMPLTPSS